MELPEEVVPAEEFALATEALVREVASTVVAAHALGVPRALQHVEQELVQDGLGATRTLDDHTGGGGGVQRGGVGPTCTKLYCYNPVGTGGATRHWASPIKTDTSLQRRAETIQNGYRVLKMAAPR